MEKDTEVEVSNQVNGGMVIKIEDFYRCGLPPIKKACNWRVIEFTRKAKQRLSLALGTTDWSKYVFETCLYLPFRADPCQGKPALKAVRRWLKRNFINAYAFYVLEFKDGTPHYHFLIDFNEPVKNPTEVMQALTLTWDKHCENQISLNRLLSPVRNLEATCYYVAKAEQKEVPKHVKKMPRFWGRFGKSKPLPKRVIACDRAKGQAIRGLLADILKLFGARPGYVECVRQCKKIVVFLRRQAADSFELSLGALEAPYCESVSTEDGEVYYVECGEEDAIPSNLAVT